jgi:predicted aspartyl protease
MLSIAVLWAGPPEDTLSIGRKALQNDGVATAWKIAQKALADTPDSAQAHEFAGEVLFRRADFAQANAEFTHAAELNRQLASAWWGLGRVAECAAMNRTAVEDYKRAYELDPKDPRIVASWILRLPGRERDRAFQAFAATAGGTAESKELQQQIELAKALDGRETMALASPYHAAEIPLRGFVSGATHMRTYGLEVMVNGTPVNLVLDTGAAGIVMSRAAAERAGLARVADSTVQGIGDGAKATGGYRAIAEHFRIGDVEYRNALVNVTGQSLAGIEDGLIGSNVFSEFLMTLDFGAGKLRLNPLPGYRPGELQDRMDLPAMRDAARVFRFGHILLVPVKINSHAGLFVLDTGAARTLMSYDLAAEASKINRDERTGVRGLNGKVGDVYETGNVMLEFGGFAQRNLGMTAIDTWQLSHRLGTEISGFLGLPVLDFFTLTIDYRDGLVKFERRR